MLVDILFLVYGMAVLVVVLPGVWVGWHIPNETERIWRWVPRWGLPLISILLFLGGWWASLATGRAEDERQRSALATEVSALARAINPERATQLHFSEADLENPAFLRLRTQLRAYAENAAFDYVFTVALRDDALVFGPESIDPDDPLASPPGTRYKLPPDELGSVFRDGITVSVGPYTDEYGTFISAFAPVFDPVTRTVILSIAADIGADDWHKAVTRARVFPLIFTIALLAVLAAGSIALRKRYLLPQEERPHYLRYVEATICACIGLALTLAISWMAYSIERRVQHSTFEALARAKGGAVTESIRDMRMRVESLGAFFDASELVDPSEFDIFASVLAGDGLSQSWEFAQAVPAHELPHFEEHIRASHIDTFAVWEKGPDNDPVPVSGRDIYYPVIYVAPEVGNENVYGYDVGSEAARLEALEKAVHTGMTTTTDPIILVQEDSIQRGTLTFRPVWNGEDLYGFALVTFRFRPMLRHALTQAGQQHHGIAVELYQLKPHAPPQFLATSSVYQASRYFCDHTQPHDLCVIVPFFAFGNAYALAIHAEPSWLAAHGLWVGWAIAAAGLLLTVALTAFILWFTNHRARLETEVARRTAALEASESQLRTEQTKLERILDGMPNGVYLVSKDYDIRYVNPALREQFGSPEGRKCYDYLHGLSAPCTWCMNDEVFQGKTVHWECTFLQLGRIFDVYDTPVTDSDGTPCKLSVFHDITDIREAQETLRISEARTAATLRSIGDGVISTDMNGHVIEINAAAAALTGWTPEDAAGRRIEEVFSIVNGRTGEPAEIPIWEALSTGQAVNLANHTILTSRDGTESHIADSCAPIRTMSGELMGAVLVFRDVTHEFEMQRDLAASNARFEQISLQSREVIWEIDLSGLYTYVSDAARDVFGYEPDELVGKMHYYDLHPEEGREPFIKESQAIMGRCETIRNYENLIQHKDGHSVIVSTNGLPVFNEAGERTGYRGADLDITARKQMEAALRESKDRLTSILNAMNDVVWTASPFPNLTLQYITPATQKLYGRPAEEFYENPLLWREVVVSEDAQKVASIWNQLEQTGTVDIEYRITRPDNSICWVRDRRQCIYDETNSVVRIDGILSDITTRKLIEEALRESEVTYRVLFEGSRDAMMILDVSTGRFTTGNQAAFEMFGIQDKKAFTESGPITLSPEYQPDGTPTAEKAKEAFSIAQREGAHYFDWVHQRANGETFPATVLLNKIVTQKKLFLQATVRDITEQKKAEEALQLSREQYMLAVNGSNDGIFDWDLRTNDLFLSPKWKQMIGYEDEELPNAFPTFEDRIHPDDKPRVMDYVQQYLKGNIDTYAIEFRFLHRDGHYLWILARGEALRDEQGIPYRMAGSHSDITARKEAEEALRASEEKHRLLAENTMDAIWQMDMTLRFTYINPACERLVGYTPEEYIGTSLQDHCTPETMATISEVMAEAIANNESSSLLEVELFHKDGTLSPFEIHATMIRDEAGLPIAIQGVTRDIRERKQAEKELLETNRRLEEAIGLANQMAAEAEMANAAKGAFLANVSHEIRTPLNGIIGMTTLLLDTDMIPSQRRCAEVIRDSGESLLWLINDILDFSKIEAGKLELETIDFDLHSLLDDFATLLGVKADEKGLELVCAAEPDVPPWLRGDPGRLRQILTNLAGNAIKFTHAGEVVVNVSKLSENEAGALLRFSVRDTGIGIPPDKQDKLFQSFTQVDATTTRVYGGTGLGLAITKQLVELMQGEVGFTSTEGEGSEFWFVVRLPVREDSGHDTLPSADLRGARTLVVDDNAANREMLCAQLRAIGMTPAEAANGTVALEMLREAKEAGRAYNIAILDMLMPGMDGETLGRAIQEDEALNSTSLVMMTSIGRRGDARRLEYIGFDVYLTKPVRQADLYDCLSAALASDKDDEKTRRRPIVTRHYVRELRRYHAHVLLAEDNTVNQQVAVGMLQKMGVSVNVVNNGREALAALAKHAYDLVLMDVQMPEMDGLEASRQIRKSTSRIDDPNVPIIAMTAHITKEARDACMEATMNDYISKPLDPGALADVLKKWLPEKKRVKDVFEKSREDEMEPAEMDGGDVLFDKAGLLARVMNDMNLAQVLVATFLGDMPQQLADLEDLLNKGDIAGATRQAHSIKGASANVGAVALSQVAAAMETAGKEGETTSMKELLQELKQCLNDTEQAMETL